MKNNKRDSDQYTKPSKFTGFTIQDIDNDFGGNLKNTTPPNYLCAYDIAKKLNVSQSYIRCLLSTLSRENKIIRNKYPINGKLIYCYDFDMVKKYLPYFNTEKPPKGWGSAYDIGKIYNHYSDPHIRQVLIRLYRQNKISRKDYHIFIDKTGKTIQYYNLKEVEKYLKRGNHVYN